MTRNFSRVLTLLLPLSTLKSAPWEDRVLLAEPGEIYEMPNINSKERIKGIYEVLPKLNCGFCGFGSCGQFARAVAEGRASPFGCRQTLWLGYKISEIIGMKVPAYTYGYKPVLAPALGVTISPKALKEEVRGLSRKVDDILARIENLKARR